MVENNLSVRCVCVSGHLELQSVNLVRRPGDALDDHLHGDGIARVCGGTSLAAAVLRSDTGVPLHDLRLPVLSCP